jgi:hypothetical protein
LQYQKTFFRSALTAAAKHPVKAYVVSSPRDPERLHRFFDLLSLHRIDARSLSRRIEVDGKTYEPASSLLVTLSQPQHRMIRSIFETTATFEDVGFYDVSTWTLPLAYGLQFSQLGSKEFRPNAVGGTYSHSEAPPLTVDKSAYAYIIEWERYSAPRALYAVLRHGLHATVATVPFSSMTLQGSREFAPGSVVVSSDGQPLDHAEIATLVAELNSIDGIAIHSLRSGKSTNGNAGVDLGDPSFRPLVLPEILLVVDSGISWYDAGETWHLLDRGMHIPVTLVKKSRLSRTDLGQYTHIVFSGGNYSRSRQLTGQLQVWVEQGGTLIGMRQAAQWIQDGMLKKKSKTSDSGKDSSDKPGELDTASDEWRLDYKSRTARAALDRVSGAIFAADLDISHPLGFGYAERDIAVHRNTTDVLARTNNRYATILQYTSSPLLSGYASKENQQAIADTPALIAERLGKGSIVLFADNPNFRGYWFGTNKLFLNALFFSKAFDNLSGSSD